MGFRGSPSCCGFFSGFPVYSIILWIFQGVSRGNTSCYRLKGPNDHGILDPLDISKVIIIPYRPNTPSLIPLYGRESVITGIGH